MIVFYGELSKACKNFIIKEYKKGKLAICSVLAVLMSIISIFIAVFIHWAGLFLVFAAGWFLMVVILTMNPSKKEEELIIPQKITIVDNTLGSQSEKFNIVRSIDDIKKIIDFGSWYKIEFYFPRKSRVFICQKDLIVQGTINEFEERFNEYIVRYNS